MKVVILAGGFGTRLSEETDLKPKPMIEIGGLPLLMHIMQNFASQGFTEFVICLGYKGDIIKDYFMNLKFRPGNLHLSNLNSDLINNSAINWKIDLVDTGIETMTGGRIKRIKEFTNGESFLLTYGDGLADINIPALIEFHKISGCLATVTAVIPPARFGALEIDEKGKVKSFKEKFNSNSSWINGGFFVLEPKVNDFVESVNEPFESGALVRLVKESQLMAYHHEGFWQPMDTLREKRELEKDARLATPSWLKIEL